jgi:hypothetical protein
MRSFKKFVTESIEQAELDEAVEVRHDRYMRSHGKKASGGTGSWMFTHKAMGDVDHKNEKEVYSAPSGKFSDAKKAAQQWAKKHGHSTVYVMESVELDEKLKASDDMGDWVKDFQKSDAPQFKGKSQKKRQQMAIAAKLAAERNEEVELDEELSDKKFDKVVSTKGVVASHDRKGGVHFSKDGKSMGFKMHPRGRSGADHVHTWLQNMGFKKRGENHLGVDYHREEVELDESNLTSDDLHRIAKDHDNAAKKHGTAYDQTRSTAASRNHEIAWNRHVDAAKAHREAANDKSKHSSEKLEKMSNHAWDATDHIRKHFDESVELDEAKRDIYHQHMLKALGKSRLPKNHQYTSAIATNGDFVVKDGGSRIVGRIPKGEHNLKEAAPKIKPDFLKTQREKDRAHDAAMGRTATGRKKPTRAMTSTQRSLASMRKEEVEQLDELSPKTLGSYIKKASADQYFKGQDAQYHDNKAKNAEDPFAKETKKKHYALAARANDKASNRDTGITRAVNRLTKEEVELDEVSQDLARKTARARQQQASLLRRKAVDEPDMMKAFAHTRAANKAEKKAGQSYNRLMKKEEVDLTENVYEEVANYLVSEGIDLDNLSEAQLDELIGAAARALGRGIKRTFVNKKGNFRFSTAGRADAAEAQAKKLEKARKDRERLQRNRERIQTERRRAAQARQARRT